MTSTAESDQQVFTKNSKSFSWAARFLEPDQAIDAAQLYAFCRRIDDLADEGGAEGAATLQEMRQELVSGSLHSPELKRFTELQERRSLSAPAAIKLIETCGGDGPGLRVETVDDLIRYAYGVASTVGLLMCPILGIEDLKTATPYAIDLGVAMQLTNIARDILEDAENDRVYIPVELAGDLDPQDLFHDRGDARSRAYKAALKVLDIADSYYRSADRGLCYIPKRPRLAIIVASRVYEAIGSQIRARGEAYWESRTYVTTLGKIYHTVFALLVAFLSSRYSVPSNSAHEDGLHSAIHGYPGTNSEISENENGL